MTVEREEIIEFLERNVNLLWLLMDGLWMWGYKLVPTILVFPALTAAFAIFFIADKTPGILIGIMVGSGWILLDIFWMISELYGITWFYTLARVAFLAAIACIIIESVSSGSYQKSFSHFRKWMLKK